MDTIINVSFCTFLKHCKLFKEIAQCTNTDYLTAANYGAGLRVLDISSIPSDPTGAGVCEAGFFDIHPEDDTAEGGGIVAFTGTWSSYAYFKSGFIYINTIERGSFVVKMTSKDCAEV